MLRNYQRQRTKGISVCGYSVHTTGGTVHTASYTHGEYESYHSYSLNPGEYQDWYCTTCLGNYQVGEYCRRHTSFCTACTDDYATVER